MREKRLAIAVFCITVVVYIVRGFFGISTADESTFITAAAFPAIGARWFADEMLIQTTSSIIISPFISGFIALFGSPGVVAFSRMLYVAVSVLTALVTFRLLQHYCRRPVALMFSICIIAFVPFGMSCLTYNQIGYLFFTLGAAMSLIGSLEGKRGWAFAGGACWVLCVFGHPTYLINFAVFTALLAISFWRQKKWLSRFAPAFVAGLIAMSIPLVGVLVYCGIENVENSIGLSRNLSSPFDWNKAPWALKLFVSYLPSLWLLLVGLVTWIALMIARPAYSYAGIGLVFLIYMAFGGQSEGASGSVFWPWAQLMSLGLAAKSWRRWDQKQKKLFITLIVPCLLGAFVCMMTSRMTVYNMYGTSVIGTLAMLALVAGQDRRAGWVLAVLTLGYTLQYQVPRVYEDDLWRNLTYRMTDGPYKYLWTNPAKGKLIEKVQEDLRKIPQEGSIIFQDHFAGGFLMTGLKPRGPMITILAAFLHPEVRPFMTEIFNQNPQVWTDFVLEFRRFPVATGTEYVYRDSDGEEPTTPFFQQYDPFYNYFMRSGKYSVVVDRGDYRILQRRPGS